MIKLIPIKLKCFFILAFTCIVVFSNAQTIKDSACNCRVLFSSFALGTAFATSSNGYKPGFAGSIGLGYASKIGAIGIGGSFNLMFKPKTLTSASGLILIESFSIGYGHSLFKSKRVSGSVELTYNEVKDPDISSFPIHTGLGYNLSMGYIFWITKRGVFGISGDYHRAKLDDIDYSNIGINISYSKPIRVWKKK